MFSIDNLRLKSRTLENEIRSLQTFMDENASDDILIARNKDGAFRYARKHKTPEGKWKETYLPESAIMEIRKLAYLDYAKTRLRDARAEKAAVDHLLRFYARRQNIDDYLSRHPGIAAVLKNDPMFRSSALETDILQKAIEWKLAPYKRSAENPENLKYPTVVPNLFVRSKAEADIIARFEHFGVAYHYEEEYEPPEHLANIYGRNRTAIHPDFKCKNMRTGNVFWWEHQGQWDSSGYVAGLGKREPLLYAGGLIPWKNLIITTETLAMPLDILWVDEIIQFYLL